MEISQTKVVPVIAKTLRICMKVRDTFAGVVLDEAGNELGGQDDGYVPAFMPGDDTDYLEMDIDLDTGQITNWRKPAASQIEAFIEQKF